MRSVTFICLLLFAFQAKAQLQVVELLTEGLSEPMGLDVTQPRFTWKLKSKGQNVLQTHYELKVYAGESLTWTSGKIASDSSVWVTYKGPALNSNKRYRWSVKVWDNGQNTAQSNFASFHTGLLNAGEWKAQWISPGFTEDSINRPSPYFRKTFHTTKKVISATAFITAHGIYEAYINGKRIGEAHFTPGWTTYHHRLQYQAFNVTAMLQSENAIAVMLGSGWYRGTIGFRNEKNHYGKDVALLFQLNILYDDGSSEIIGSGPGWKSGTGKILYSEIYNGEIIDLRKEKTGWMYPGYNDKDWSDVVVNSFDKNKLVGTYNELVKQKEVFKPMKILKTPGGETVIDFGQNLAGWVRMKVKGKAGHEIILSHAEVLDKAGNFYTANLRSAKAQDRYILKDNSVEVLHPHFTWHGFRFVKVENYPGDVLADNFEAVALYSDMPAAGSFTSSHSLLNQLQSNIVWGLKGNFLDIPTDCPQRNERLGWTGDAQIFARTSFFNVNAHNFFAKWLQDFKYEQLPGGEIPNIIPNIGSNNNRAGWADAVTIIPWNLYTEYGDQRILHQLYPNMKAYVESIRHVSVDNVWEGNTFGDWLAYTPEKGSGVKLPPTNKHIITQCYYAHSTEILMKTAQVLGYKEDAALYSGLLSDIKKAFHKTFLKPDGSLVSQSQAAYILALHFNMLPADKQPQAAARLAELIKQYGHFTTGFLATPPLCAVLTRYGYEDLAFELLEREAYPSWIYPITKGATTFWERWNGITTDGSFQTDKPQSNSFNHYAHGAIGDWLYRTVAGIDVDPNSVGYKRIRIKPRMGGSLKHAEGSVETYYGTIRSKWEILQHSKVVEVEIPPNTKASVVLPTSDITAIKLNGQPLQPGSKNVRQASESEKEICVDLGSGIYRFEISSKEAR